MTNDQLTIRAGELSRELVTRPEDPGAHAELAEVTAKLGDYSSAIDHDARAWELRPSDPSPLFHILTLLVDSGKWLGAMTAYELVRETARPEAALALELAAAEVFRRIAGVFPPRGARPEADAMIDRLVASCRTRRASVKLAVARSLVDLGRIDDAVEVMDELRCEAPEDRAHLCFLRAIVCERAGDIEAAIGCYEQALALDARTDAALNLLALLVEAPEVSERIATLIAQLGPDVRDLPLVRFREAIYLRRIGDHDGATALLSRIASDRTSELGRMARQVLASC